MTATKIDQYRTKATATIEPHEIEKSLKRPDLALKDIMDAPQLTSWSLDQEYNVVEASHDRAALRVVRCETQLTRREPWEFQCKQIGHDHLKTFGQITDPEIDVLYQVCAPDRHAEEPW